MPSMKDRIAKNAETSRGTQPAAFRRPSGRASYPKRFTLDLTPQQYEFLKDLGYDGRVSVAGILRATVDRLRDDEQLKTDLVQAAHDAEHGEH